MVGIKDRLIKKFFFLLRSGEDLVICNNDNDNAVQNWFVTIMVTLI